MKAITESLGVSRSQQYEKKGNHIRQRGRYKPKEEDMLCLPLICEVISERPTYGYYCESEAPCKGRTSD